MNSAYATAPQAYRANSILTASPQQLVVMLYDGAHRFLLQGAAAMRAGDMQTVNERLRRAEAIIDELIATLDHSAGEISDRLNAIYLYSRRTLGEARVEKSPEKIEHVQGLIRELRDAWAQICPGADV
ncbi:MAG: flagellar export chaperone FliS [Actinobacteria bacterium]|nr:flagellar export chaperone FliS [Actinomycetota bacterium]